MTQYKLPPGWVLIKIQDILEVHYGKGLPKAKRDDAGNVPVYGSNGVVGKHSEALVNGTSIIIGRKGAAGAVHIARESCWPIDTTYYTQPSDALSFEYVFYALGFLDLMSLDKSTAIPGLNRDDLYSQELPLPPLPEQQRIVDEIEAQFTRLDAVVAALKRAQANLKRYRASVLKTACEGRLVPQNPTDEPAGQLLARILTERRQQWNGRGQYTEPTPLDTTNLPELPVGWMWTNIGTLFEVSIGGTPSRRKPEYWGGDIPWVSSGEVAFSRIKSTREQITRAGLENSNAKLNPTSTVLLAMIGEGKTRGQAAILDIDACNNQNVASISVSQTSILPEWVFFWLMSSYERIREGGPASGGMQPALNSAKVRALTIPLPPLAEQHRIVEEVERRLSVMDEVEATLAANLKRAERLRQAILKRAFEGKLVPQNPADEPASVLLERIRAARGDAQPNRQMALPGV